jgi:uncharacterized protein (TIGR00255 family)
MKSMTGFGRSSAAVGDRRLTVEIRSVNHRGLDVKIRGAEVDAFCDTEIARAVRAAVERGAITVQIREESAGNNASIDEGRVRAMFASLERLRRELGVAEPVTLATVGAFMGEDAVLGLSGEALWEALREPVAVALRELAGTRGQEGQSLAADLESHRLRLVSIAAEVRERAADRPDRFRRRLEERLSSLRDQPGFEPGRLAQEAALMAERLDVSEELVRLDTHLGSFAQLAREAGAIGRKLDFVIQEIGRELNTIGSKAQDAGVAGLIIEAKAELEKLREQVQNIE